MSGSQLFQFQFDILKGITIPAQYLSLLLNICGEDDIQPVAIPPLELFGGWLMVDSRRIEDGVKALKHHRRAGWKAFLLISPPKATQIVRQNIQLTSTFLFATCCSIIFDVEKTSAIIYEMMSLGGATRKYNITSDVVFRFVEVFNGFRDSFKTCEKTPIDVYHDLSEKIMERMRGSAFWISDLQEENDSDFLAKLLYKTFDALMDMENAVIELTGTKGGLWIAFAFIWLRPAETAVLVAGVLVYPEEQSGQEHFKPRLVIRLQKTENNGIQAYAEQDWSIGTWRATAIVTEPIRISRSMEHVGLNPLTSSPWRTARHQIELIKFSAPVVSAIGHVAGALIEVVMERGLLWNEDFSASKRLSEICSPWYLNTYNTIMKLFGWFDLNDAHQKSLATFISKGIEQHRYESHDDDTKAIGSLIINCFCENEQAYRQSWLIQSSVGDHEEDIIEYSIHLAAHAIISSVYRELPQYIMYRPLEPQLLRLHSKLIRDMLLKERENPQHVSNAERGVSFANLRRQAMQLAIPSPMAAGPSDLALAGQGYVVFSSALAYQEWTDNTAERPIDRSIDLADERLVGTVEVFPGCLQQEGLPGRYTKLSEDNNQMRVASRFIDREIPIELFSRDDKFQGVLDVDAHDQARVETKHFLRRDIGTRTLFLTTNLEITEQSNQSHDRPSFLIPTSWRRSIEVTVFACHVTEFASRQTQLEALARRWLREGIAMGWCRVGAVLPTNTRSGYIVTTAGKKECRFFEAGSGSENKRVFIRHGVVPLTHCIKVAMETCNNETNWVIIA